MGKLSNEKWHQKQIQFDRQHYPPASARPKIRWHQAQIVYDQRSGSVQVTAKGRLRRK